MSQPQGQENLVTWARPLMTTREGLEQLVDHTLSGTYDFEDMAKVSAIASMCVHQEVTNRPFMGEVVQALKLIYTEAGEDYCSQKDESSIPDLAPSESSWWNATPRLTYGHASPFITMDYSSGPLEDIENRGFSGSSFDVGGETSLPVNRSGPLRTVRSKPAFYRLRGGSVSEHGVLLPKRSFWNGWWHRVLILHNFLFFFFLCSDMLSYIKKCVVQTRYYVWIIWFWPWAKAISFRWPAGPCVLWGLSCVWIRVECSWPDLIPNPYFKLSGFKPLWTDKWDGDGDTIVWMFALQGNVTQVRSVQTLLSFLSSRACISSLRLSDNGSFISRVFLRSGSRMMELQDEPCSICKNWTTFFANHTKILRIDHFFDSSFN